MGFFFFGVLAETYADMDCVRDGELGGVIIRGNLKWRLVVESSQGRRGIR